MDYSHDFDNGNILSQSYIEGVKRITGNQGSFEDDFKISEELFESRAKTWSWLFEKFSEISDDIELNIRTLQQDTASSDSCHSELRIPIRKSAAQLQYWIDTGNPPHRAEELDVNDTDETVSISESEASYFDEDQSLPSASMIVNNKLTISGEQLLGTDSSPSSVDTTTYILNNASGTRKEEKDSRVSQNLGNLDNNIVGKSINALSRVTELSKNTKTRKNTSVLCKRMSAGNEEDRNGRAKIVVSANIVLNRNVGVESDQILTKASRSKIKDSEVTLESKESGIGSSAVENMENGESNDAQMFSESSDKVETLANQSMLRRRRKLFTMGNDCLDLALPLVKTTFHRNRSSIMSMHPALDPPTNGEQKPRNKPRYLTKPGVRWRTRMSVNSSTNKRNKNKSVLSKLRAHRTSPILHSDTLKSAALVETTSIPLENEDSNPVIGYTDRDTLNSTAPTRTNNSLEDKDTNPTVNADADGAERSKEHKVSSPSLSKKMKKRVTCKSLVNSSSSLSSNDASQIINEELNKISEIPFAVVPKNNQTGQLPVEKIPRSQSKNRDNDQGSMFKYFHECILKTRASKAQSMAHVKKNLCATDFRSSEDSFSNASTILFDSGNCNKNSKSSKNSFTNDFRNSAKFNPRVIVHDFLNIKNCCGKLEKKNNQYWLHKQNKRYVLRSSMKRIHEKTTKMNNSGSNAKSVKSKKEVDQKVPVNKKPKMRNEATSSERNRKTSHSRNHCSLKEKTSDLRVERAEDDYDNSATRGNLDGKISNGDNPMVIFTNTSYNRWDSIFSLTSSDEEDVLKKLSITPKSKSLKKKNAESYGKEEPSASVTTDSNGFKTTKTRQESYIIISSSSEEEENTVGMILRSRRLTKKNSKRNKRNVSTESELTMRSAKDECEDRSENLRHDDDKEEKQLPDINSKRPERKKSKQSSEVCRDYLVPRKEVDGQIQSDRRLRARKLDDKNSEKSRIKSSKQTEYNKVVLKMNDKENDPNKISESSVTPVIQISNSRQKRVQTRSKSDSRLRNGADKSKRGIDSVENHWDEESQETSGISSNGMQIKIFRKIARAAESSDSQAESEVSWKPNYKDRRKVSVEMEDADDSSVGVIKENEITSSAFKLHFDDESSDNDDIMNLLSKNYAGDNSRDKGNDCKDRDIASDEIDSCKYPDSLNKCGSDVKRRFTSSSKKNITNELTNSKIVFRTKEYWESDSDKC